MATPTRRSFLKSAGVAATPSAAATAAVEKQPGKRPYRRSSFTPAGRPEKLTENLYRLQITGGPLGLNLRADSAWDGLVSLLLVTVISAAPMLLIAMGATIPLAEFAVRHISPLTLGSKGE